MARKSTSAPQNTSESEEPDWYATPDGRRQTQREFVRALRTGTLDRSDGLVAAKTDPRLIDKLMEKAKEEATRPISLRIPVADLERAQRIAQRTGVGYQTVLKQAIRAGLKEDWLTFSRRKCNGSRYSGRSGQIVGGSERGGQNGSAGGSHSAIGRWQRVRPRTDRVGAGSLISRRGRLMRFTQAVERQGRSKLVRGKGAWTLPRARRRAASENKALPTNGAQSSSLLSAIVSWNCDPS